MVYKPIGIREDGGLDMRHYLSKMIERLEEISDDLLDAIVQYC